MSFDTARALIATRWKLAWDGGPLAAMPIEFQNQPFERPQGQVWGRYTLLPAETTPAALGSRECRFERTPFVLVLQVFSPENSGSRAPYQAADVMAAMNYQTDRETGSGGTVVVNYDTAGLTPAVAEDGFDGFNVTIKGSFDTYPAV